MDYRSEVAAVKRLNKTIDQGEASVDGAKWERAERIARLCDEYRQGDVAADTGLTRQTVNLILRVWETGGVSVGRNRRPYVEVYYEVRGATGNESGKAGTPEEKAALVKRHLKDAQVREVIAADPAARSSVFATAKASHDRWELESEGSASPERRAVERKAFSSDHVMRPVMAAHEALDGINAELVVGLATPDKDALLRLLQDIIVKAEALKLEVALEAQP